MSKKDKKLTKAAHIKRHTEGTSNELSFSVLDAAKNRADAEEGKDEKAKVPHFGGIPLFSWHLGKKKNISTPTREDSLPLSSGDIITPSSSEVRAGNQSGTIAGVGSGGIGTGGIGSGGFGPTIAGGTSLGSSLSGGAAASYVSPEDEIERRKRRRRRQKIFAGVVAAVVVFALVGGGGWWLYQEISKHQVQVSLLEQSLSLIKESDETTLAMDKTINKPIDATSAEDISAILDGVPRAKELLDEAEGLVNEALNDMRDSSDKEAVEQAIVAIQARREILDYGETLLNADMQAENDKEAIKQVWDKVLEADEVAREAAAMITDTTPENVAASTEKTNEAILLLGDAVYYLDDLSGSYLNPDIQPLYDYIGKRREALNYAIASNDAILAKERVKAEEQNEAYNTADLEASVLAKDLPEDITSIVTTAYEEQTAETREQYNEVRLKASTADTFLRDYLGTRNK